MFKKQQKCTVYFKTLQMFQTFLISKRNKIPDIFHYLRINMWDGTNTFTPLSFALLEWNLKTVSARSFSVTGHETDLSVWGTESYIACKLLSCVITCKPGEWAEIVWFCRWPTTNLPCNWLFQIFSNEMCSSLLLGVFPAIFVTDPDHLSLFTVVFLWRNISKDTIDDNNKEWKWNNFNSSISFFIYISGRQRWAVDTPHRTGLIINNRRRWLSMVLCQ